MKMLKLEDFTEEKKGFFEKKDPIPATLIDGKSDDLPSKPDKDTLIKLLQKRQLPRKKSP